MVQLSVMGREVLVEGHGTEEEPFIVHGIKNNPPLAAVAEQAMIDHWMGEGNWILLETELHMPEKDRTLAVLSIRTFEENEEVVQGKVWFDVSQAFARALD